MAKKHLNIKVSGLVQGVFFRHGAKEKADQLGITGFIRNEPDGSVYIEAEGGGESLNKFIEWCKRGPDSARVDSVEIKEGEFKNFQDFIIG